MASAIRRVKVCLNGQRGRAEHPALPVTPAELAAEAAAAVAAGAEAVHLHPRGSDERESLQAAHLGAAVSAVRAACPQIPVGVTTALWVTGDAQVRHEEVAGWACLDPRQRPDFASVNVSEDGWHQLTGLLAALGIRAEAGVWSVADASAAARFAPPGGWLRILAEIPGSPPPEALSQATAVLDQLRAGGVTAPVLLHGEDESCWPLIREAGRLGLASRIGLEDVLTGPDGERAADNASLVRLGLAQWAAGSAPGAPGAAPGRRRGTG
jgi:uncharacterized protein (DUF849 family)